MAKISWPERLYLLILYPLIYLYISMSNLWNTPQVDLVPSKGKPSICFAGCAFLYPYYIGIMKYLIEMYDLEDVKFVALSSACYPLVSYVANGVEPEKWMHTNFPACIRYWNRRFLGFLLDTPSFLRELWTSSLRPDAYKRASEGNLEIALTRATLTPPFIQQIRVSEFHSNQDLIDCIIASGHIPGMFGCVQTKFRGKAFVDGAIAESYPLIDKQTIVVDVQGYYQARWRQLFCSTKHIADISPSKPYGILEMYGLFGVPEISRCDELVKDGYRDAAAADDIFLSRGWIKKNVSKLERMREI